MRYCVSSRQPKNVLEQADEIRIEYKDINYLIDLLIDEKINNKTFIIDVPKDTEVDWNKIKTYSTNHNIIICLYDLHYINICKEYELKYYWAYPITTMYDLNALINLEVSYLFLGAPLCFMLDKCVNKTDIPIRLCPNLAYDAYIPRSNGIFGSWIRPEDIKDYEKYVRCMDFVGTDLKEEMVLLNIYKNQKSWPGNLNLLIKNFNINVDNRALPEEIGHLRTNCQQRCMSNGTCRFCETAIRFANQIRDEHYARLGES